CHDEGSDSIPLTFTARKIRVNKRRFDSDVVLKAVGGNIVLFKERETLRVWNSPRGVFTAIQSESLKNPPTGKIRFTIDDRTRVSGHASSFSAPAARGIATAKAGVGE